MTKSLCVAAKAAETSAARLCAAAAEASQPHPADTSVSAGSQHQQLHGIWIAIGMLQRLLQVNVALHHVKMLTQS